MATGALAASLLTLTGLATASPAVADSPTSVVAPTAASELTVTTKTYETKAFSTTVSGTGTPGTLISLSIAGRLYGANVTDDGTWSVAKVIGLVAPSYEGSVSEISGDDDARRIVFTLTSSTADRAPAAPVVTTTGYDPAALTNTISGTALPDALISVRIAERLYSPRADAAGAWTITTITGLRGGSQTGTASQIANGEVSNEVSFTLRPDDGVVIAPPTVTTTRFSRAALVNAVSGTGIPGALVGLTVASLSYDTRVAEDGTWTVPRVTALTGQSHEARVFQVSGSLTSDTALFTLTADVPVAPVDVASPANPAVGYQANQPFTFSGQADDLADTVTVRNFAGTLVATVPVDPTSGAWSWTRANMGTSTWKLTFISNEGKPDEEKTTLADFKPAAIAPAIRPIAFTNPANPAAGYVAGSAFTFRGTATPGAKITLQNDKGAVFATGITAASDGTWSWTRANLGTSIWKITAIADAGTPSEQTVTLGNFAPQK